MDAIRRFVILPVMCYVFINYGITDLEQHRWAVYAMPLFAIVYVLYLAIKNTPKGDAYVDKSNNRDFSG